MANFRQVHVKAWKDPWFLDLRPDEKLLFIYLVTNEQTNLAGIYEIASRVISFETGMEPARVSEILSEFDAADKVKTEGDLVWVVNMRRYHENTSDKVKIRIVADVDNIPYCDLKKQYIGYYPPPIGYAYHIDTLSHKEEEEDEDEDEQEDEKEDEPFDDFPKILQAIDALSIFCEITSMPAIPNSKDRGAPHTIENLYDLRSKYDSRPDMVADGKHYFSAWTGRKYSRTNTAWVDWWIAGEVPQARKPKNNKPPVKEFDQAKADRLKLEVQAKTAEAAKRRREQ